MWNKLKAWLNLRKLRRGTSLPAALDSSLAVSEAVAERFTHERRILDMHLHTHCALHGCEDSMAALADAEPEKAARLFSHCAKGINTAIRAVLVDAYFMLQAHRKHTKEFHQILDELEEKAAKPVVEICEEWRDLAKPNRPPKASMEAYLKKLEKAGDSKAALHFVQELKALDIKPPRSPESNQFLLFALEYHFLLKLKEKRPDIETLLPENCNPLRRLEGTIAGCYEALTEKAKQKYLNQFPWLEQVIEMPHAKAAAADFTEWSKKTTPPTNIYEDTDRNGAGAYFRSGKI